MKDAQGWGHQAVSALRLQPPSGRRNTYEQKPEQKDEEANKTLKVIAITQILGANMHDTNIHRPNNTKDLCVHTSGREPWAKTA